MRFSIRDLLWLTLLAAFAVGWWIDRSRLAAEVDRLKPEPFPIDFAFPVSVISPVDELPVIVQPDEIPSDPPRNGHESTLIRRRRREKMAE
jgi:hypothetical protein